MSDGIDSKLSRSISHFTAIAFQAFHSASRSMIRFAEERFTPLFDTSIVTAERLGVVAFTLDPSISLPLSSVLLLSLSAYCIMNIVNFFALEPEFSMIKY